MRKNTHVEFIGVFQYHTFSIYLFLYLFLLEQRNLLLFFICQKPNWHLQFYPRFLLLFVIGLLYLLVGYLFYVVWWLLVIDFGTPRNFLNEYLSEYSHLLSFQVSLMKCRNSRLGVVQSFWMLGFLYVVSI